MSDDFSDRILAIVESVDQVARIRERMAFVQILDDELVVFAQRAVVRLQGQLLELLVLPHPALRAEVGDGDRTQRLDELLGLERRQIARRVAKRAVQKQGADLVCVFRGGSKFGAREQ
jgi:hypothetical protein